MLAGAMRRSAFRRATARDRPRGRDSTAWRSRKPARPRLFVLGLVVSLVAGACAGARARAEAPDSDEPAGAWAFEADRLELQLGVRPFFSLQETSKRRPQIDDVGAHLRLGWMLTSPGSDGFWRGNLEILVSAQGSAVVVGPGSFFAGGSFLLRRNFVRSGARFVPYAQLEVGALHNDVHDNPDQRVVGQSFEFELGGGVGSRVLIRDAWAVYGEVDYRHVSNGGLAARNLGLNSVGALIGIARFF